MKFKQLQFIAHIQQWSISTDYCNIQISTIQQVWTFWCHCR